MCSGCENTQIKCVYRDDSGLSDESQSLLLEVFRTLNSLPDDQVLERVRSLKREIDPSAILSNLRGRAITLPHANSSGESAMMSDVFQTMELGPQFPNAYPTIPVLDLETLGDATYQQLVQATKRDSDTGHAGGHARPLCDSRLANLNISDWTNVSVNNSYAARAISLYLETDHPLLGFFEPNGFVSDLATGKTDYCSRMLVNALLYWACVSPRSVPSLKVALRI